MITVKKLQTTETRLNKILNRLYKEKETMEDKYTISIERENAKEMTKLDHQLDIFDDLTDKLEDVIEQTKNLARTLK
jgi:hypothetical protein